MKLILITTLLISLFISGISELNSAEKVNKKRNIKGFQEPESVVYDTKREQLYVSNVYGAPLEVDGNGFISKVLLNGKVKKLNWITNLNGPKGMEIYGNLLYVTDINQLVVIDLNKEAITKRYSIPSAKFLNDVSIDQSGNVYVSDMLDDAIYRLSDGKFELWLKSPLLQGPNGLNITKDQLIVASWGVLSEGFATSVAGHLKTISLTDKSIKSLGNGEPVGNLDGLEPDGNGNYYVTDWLSGKLLLINTSGEAETLLDINQGSADLEFIKEKGLVFIPMMNDNLVSSYKITD